MCIYIYTHSYIHKHVQFVHVLYVCACLCHATYSTTCGSSVCKLKFRTDKRAPSILGSICIIRLYLSSSVPLIICASLWPIQYLTRV
jgi:hypothetical protein